MRQAIQEVAILVVLLAIRVLQVIRRMAVLGESRPARKLWHTLPRVEEFEPRLVLAAFTWNHTGTDMIDWNTFGKWLKDGAATTQLPGQNDDVTFDGAAANGPVKVFGSNPKFKSLTVKGNFSELKLISSLSSIEVTSDSIFSSGKITQTLGARLLVSGGTFTWSGGQLNSDSAGQGRVVVTGANTNFVIKDNAAAIGSTIEVGSPSDAGKLTIQTLNQDLQFNINSGIIVDRYGTFDLLQGSGNVLARGSVSGGTDGIENSGIVNFDTAANVQVGLPLVNESSGAAVNVKRGVLQFTRAGRLTGFSIAQNFGSINIYAGAELRAAYGYNQNDGSLNTWGDGLAYLTGNAYIHGGNVYIATDAGAYGRLQVEGNVTMDGGTLHIFIDANTGSHDKLYVGFLYTITLGGTSRLEVTTLGGQPAAGTTFDILYGSSIFGDFATKSFGAITYTPSIVDDESGLGKDYRLTA